MLAVSLTGCKWDGENYDTYVPKQKRIVLCPPELQYDYNGEQFVTLDNLRCYKNRVEPEWGAFAYPTDYNLCESYRRMGFHFDGKISFIGTSSDDKYSKGIEAGICPADYPVCVYRGNEWGCEDCPTGMIKCHDICINPLSDHDYCGADLNCDFYTVCQENEICIKGSCVVNDCPEGKDKCDVDMCVDTHGDNPEHCGGCNFNCRINDNESTRSVGCSNGTCLRECRDGYKNCSITADSLICISEENLKSDRSNCGDCYIACNPNEVCINGHCETNTCADPDMTLCAGAGEQRECRNIKGSDESNCGACGYKCSEHPSATAVSNLCVEGVCLYGCKEGYTNCSASPYIESIICVSDEMMLSDGHNCGRCGHVCEKGFACINGDCVKNTCINGETLCDENGSNVCRNVKGNDAANCGACGFKCSEHPQSHAQSNKCKNGLCQFECELGYFNVGTDAIPDCIDPLTNPKHCGQINLFTADTLQDCGENACVNGVCRSTTCSDPDEIFCQYNQNGHITTECVNLNTDIRNCGYCGYECPENNGNSATTLKGCVNGVCEYKCAGGMYSCPNAGSSQLNCADINNDSDNCGACGRKCLPGEYCFFGTCMTSDCDTLCSPGTGCSKNGCPTVNCYNVTEYCGASCTDCVEMAHGDKGYTSCDKNTGECLIEKCQYGYHMEMGYSGRKICVQNANASCGSRSMDNHTSCGAGKECSNDLERCVVHCEPGKQHPNAEGTACEPDSTTACGRSGHTCFSEGVRNAKCENGKCVVELCLVPYHKKTVDGDMICVKNSEYECGDHLTNCMDSIYHAKQAACTDGKCDIGVCEEGYQRTFKQGGGSMCNKFVCNNRKEYAACE